MKTSIIIIGAGGHAKVLIETLQLMPQVEIVGLLDVRAEKAGQVVAGVKILGTDEAIHAYPPSEVQLVNGIGSVDLPLRRMQIFNRFKARGYTFFSVIHPRAYISKSAICGEGLQIMAGGIIQTECRLGANVLVNTGALIDHESCIHDHVHIAPGSVICGNVTLGAHAHIGTGAVIMQGRKVGERCLVAAGAVVIHDIAAGMRVVGVPAKRMQSVKEEITSEQLE